MKKYTIYTVCIKCDSDKNPSKHPWCKNCTRESYAKKPYCKCGRLKEKLTSYSCRTCHNEYYKLKKYRNFIKQSKDICNENSKLVKFVERIERRGGLCSMMEIFELVDIWESVNTNTIKYDNLSSVRQIEKMWNDVKKIYYTSKKDEKTGV